MFSQSELLGVTNNFFPGNYGIIITGSQKDNTVLKKEKDIDIIVLDTKSSSQWTLIAQKDGYKIEFIVLPVSDMENILDNDLYEPKNGLLSLAQGVPLSDPYGIIKPFLEKVESHFNTVQFKTNDEYHKYFIELMKLRKLFTATLSRAEKIILLCDFISIISLLEVIRVTNWSSKTKHKLINLSTKSPDFLLKIEQLFQKGINNDFDDIITYINFYQNSYSQSHLSNESKYKRLVIDIGYKDFSFSNFVNKILSEILEDTRILNAYQYFYLSPKKYTRKYKHDICLVFSIDNEVQALEILSIIQNSLSRITNPLLQFDYFCEGCENTLIVDNLNELKICINKIIVGDIKKDNDFDSLKVINFLFLILFYLKKQLKILNKDFQIANFFIGQKFLFTNEEQLIASNPQALMQLMNKKIAEAESFYKENLPDILQLLLVDNKDFTNKTEYHNRTFEIIDNFCLNKESINIPNNDISLIIINASGFLDSKTVWLYKLIVENILLVLNINDSEKHKCLFSASKGILETGI